MIITIDGPAGTGKSTVAKKVAQELGFSYFDTGALYRSITWKILKEKIPFSDQKKVQAVLVNFYFDVRIIDRQAHYFVDGEDVTEAIRSEEVTKAVSAVSALKDVRDALRKIQEKWAVKGNAIFEGRDLGTVVFPNAEMKFFLTARPEVRAKRRFKELVEKFPCRLDITLEKILEDIRIRDDLDSKRKVAPFKKAEDAIVIDTSEMSIKEVVLEMEKHIKKRV